MLFSSWNHKNQRTDREDALYESVRVHMARLEAGREQHLAALYPMVLSQDRELANLAAGAVHAYMSSLDAPKIIRLDRQFRQYTSMEWTTDWTKISPERIRDRVGSRDVWLSVLRLGTLHPNGYFRERCMDALAEDEASFPYLTLRLNDWVKQVRDRAYAILSNRLDGVRTDTAVEMLPFFSRTKKGGRYAGQQMQEIEKKLGEKILLHLHEISLERIRDYPPAAKRFLYRILLKPEVLSGEDAGRLLEREKSGNEKMRIIRLILTRYGCTDEEVEHYLKNKSPVVRKKALELKYDRMGGAWTGLEEHLMDRAKGIRSDVCYILQKHTDFDVVSFYKANLHPPGEAVAILGIGENGSVKDAALLTGYLSSEKPGLIKNAMRALSRLGAAGLDDIYWKYLQDPDPGISKTAYEAVVRSDIYYGSEQLYRAYQACAWDHGKKYLLKLLVREPSWERLPWLLRLYRPCDSFSDRMQILLHGAVRSRSVYARIRRAQADEIIRILELPTLPIPEGLKREILFDLKHLSVI